MDRIITRISVVLVTVYFLMSYIMAQMGTDILTNAYVVLFEMCVVAYTFCSGKFSLHIYALDSTFTIAC